MTINIFMYPFGLQIDPGPKFIQYGMYTKDHNTERLQRYLEEFIPQTCGKINLYCDNNVPLNEVLNIVSYAHNIGAALTVNTYDMTKLGHIDDWNKINNNVNYDVNIVF